MPVRHQFSTTPPIAVVQATGKINLKEILADSERMFSDARWKPGTPILCDYREVDTSALSTSDLWDIVSSDVSRSDIFGGSRCAVVTNVDAAFGVTRMWDSLSASSSLVRQVFRDLDSAADWLGVPRAVVSSFAGLETRE